MKITFCNTNPDIFYQKQIKVYANFDKAKYYDDSNPITLECDNFKKDPPAIVFMLDASVAEQALASVHMIIEDKYYWRHKSSTFIYDEDEKIAGYKLLAVEDIPHNTPIGQALIQEAVPGVIAVQGHLDRERQGVKNLWADTLGMGLPQLNSKTTPNTVDAVQVDLSSSQTDSLFQHQDGYYYYALFGLPIEQTVSGVKSTYAITGDEGGDNATIDGLPSFVQVNSNFTFLTLIPYTAQGMLRNCIDGKTIDKTQPYTDGIIIPLLDDVATDGNLTLVAELQVKGNLTGTQNDIYEVQLKPNQVDNDNKPQSTVFFRNSANITEDINTASGQGVVIHFERNYINTDKTTGTDYGLLNFKLTLQQGKITMLQQIGSSSAPNTIIFASKTPLISVDQLIPLNIGDVAPSKNAIWGAWYSKANLKEGNKTLDINTLFKTWNTEMTANTEASATEWSAGLEPWTYSDENYSIGVGYAGKPLTYFDISRIFQYDGAAIEYLQTINLFQYMKGTQMHYYFGYGYSNDTQINLMPHIVVDTTVSSIYNAWTAFQEANRNAWNTSGNIVKMNMAISAAKDVTKIGEDIVGGLV